MTACALAIAACIGRAEAAGCNFEIQGEGRVTAVVDARSLRLDDGREVARIEGYPGRDGFWPMLGDMLQQRGHR